MFDKALTSYQLVPFQGKQALSIRSHPNATSISLLFEVIIFALFVSRPE